MLSLRENQHNLKTRKNVSPSHVKTVECHPSCSIGLAECSPSRQWFRTVEETNVIEPQESTLEDILSAGILAVHPPEWVVVGERRMRRRQKLCVPSKIQKELLKDTF